MDRFAIYVIKVYNEKNMITGIYDLISKDGNNIKRAAIQDLNSIISYNLQNFSAKYYIFFVNQVYPGWLGVIIVILHTHL